MARFKPLPPLERLQEVLDYNPETGLFTWKMRRSHNAKAGDTAGVVANTGYIFLSIDNRKYLAHRVAWLFATGSDPGGFDIDHRDRDRANNRFHNLRLATPAENLSNSKTRVDSSTGLKGVHFYKRVGKWTAGIRIDGVKKHLGYFEDPVEAHRAYQKAALELKGDFARFE